MRISRYLLDSSVLPLDLFADPDGDWEYPTLVEAAGFDSEAADVFIGALTETYDGHPDGSAVVFQPGCSYLAIVECIPEPIQLRPRFIELEARPKAA
jgi:hypothetical protein